MERISETIYHDDGTVTRRQTGEKSKKPSSGAMRVLAWQCAVSLLLCMGAAGLRHWAPERAEQLRQILVAEGADPVSRAARCFLEDLSAGEELGQAIAVFREVLTDGTAD